MSDQVLLLDLVEVAKLLRVSQRALWGWAKAGEFPAPIQLGRLRRWRREDVNQWLADQAAAAQVVAADLASLFSARRPIG
jgi:prophage regulatory protein